MTTSLQIPDLVSSCSPFALRINKHCREVSRASETWLIDAGVKLDAMGWDVAKPGLLAAACHPCADAAQLRFIADLWGLLMHHRERTALGEDEPVGGDVDIFALLSDRLARVAYRHPQWYMGFVKSQRSYLEARSLLSKNAARGVVPDLESYIEHGRGASGFRMALDMVQYAGDVDVPEVALRDPVFAKLHDLACDIATWSVDIVSCAKGVPSTHDANLVTILMRERRLPLECALLAAGTLIKQTVDAFVASEEVLLSASDVAADRDVRQYLDGLRNWIAGFVNWLYETELFFGDKGNEVRAFGWIFVPIAR